MWFSASVLIHVEREDRHAPYTIYENIILVEAASKEEGLSKARRYGQQEEIDDPSLTIDGVKAKMKFLGVRKLIPISNLDAIDPENAPLDTGTEVSYSRYMIENASDLQKLISGDEVDVCYIE